MALLAGLLTVAAPVSGGVWGDPWGSLIWGPRTQDVPDGLSLYAPTAELSGAVTGCYDLLAELGGPGTVETISRILTATESTEQCAYQDTTPVGDDYPIELGAAYLVKLTQTESLASGPPPGCPDTVLQAGVNAVGVGKPLPNLTCADVIATFAPGVVASVERLDPDTRRFQSCTRVGAGPVTGTNFPIVAGEGYLLHAESPGGPINLNDLSHPVCQ